MVYRESKEEGGEPELYNPFYEMMSIEAEFGNLFLTETEEEENDM